jgi:hypothetical protein
MDCKKYIALALIAILAACHQGQPDSQQSSSLASSEPTASNTTTAPLPAPLPTSTSSDAKSFACAYDLTDHREMTIVMDQFSPSPDGSSEAGSYSVHGGAYDGAKGTVNLNDTEYDFNDGPLGAHSAVLNVESAKSPGLLFDNIPYLCTQK